MIKNLNFWTKLFSCKTEDDFSMMLKSFPRNSGTWKMKPVSKNIIRVSNSYNELGDIFTESKDFVVDLDNYR